MKTVCKLIILIILLCPAHSFARQRILFTTDSFPPFYYEENGKIKGIQYKLAAHIFKKMRLPFDIKFLPWKRALMHAEAHKSDGIFGLRKTKEREHWLIYPEEPLMIIRTVIFHRANEEFKYTGIKSLAGKKVGIIKGYTYGTTFDDSKLFNREEVNSLKLNFLKLEAGRIDLVAAYRAVGIHTLEQMKLEDKISFSYEPVHTVPIYIGFTKVPENEKLAETFSDTLIEFKKSSECKDFFKKLNIQKDLISPCYETHK